MIKLLNMLVLVSLVLTININAINSYALNESVLTQMGYTTQSTYIYISDNSLTSFDFETFKNLQSLTFIYISSTSLNSISNSKKLKFPNLKSLMVYGDKLNNVSIDNVIYGLDNLTNLDLSIYINPIKPNQLSTLKKLTDLALRTTNQLSLAEAHFSGLVSLERLRFLMSNIQTVDVHTFENLLNLKTLDLSYNSITSFEYLQIPPNLEGLFLFKNNMNYFKLSRTMGVLRILNINGNRFRSFKSMDFTFLTNLTTLVLSDNPNAYPCEIAGYLEPLVNLQYVDLSNLSISYIDSDFFKYNPKLWAVYLNYNKISSFDNLTFTGLKNLTWIFLNGNKLSRLEEGTFSNLSLLTAVNLAKNQIYQIDRTAFLGSSNLNLLDLSYNQLNALDDFISYSGSQKIYNIILSNNKITKIAPGSLSNVSFMNIALDNNLLTELSNTTLVGQNRVVSINIQQNKLSSVEPGTFTGLTTLQTIDLSDNQLTQLDSSTFSGCNSLLSISLRNNPNLSTTINLCPTAATQCQVYY